MAVGMIVGVGSEPTPQEFEYLLDKGGLPQEGFTYEAVSLTAEEAADRDQLREMYKAACVKQNWLAGVAMADDLVFTEVAVGAKRIITVTPPVAPKESAPGGIIGGIGFQPAQSDVQALAGLDLITLGRQYVLQSYTEGEARHDEGPITAYLVAAKRQGWSIQAQDITVDRQDIDGKKYILIAADPAG